MVRRVAGRSARPAAPAPPAAAAPAPEADAAVARPAPVEQPQPALDGEPDLLVVGRIGKPQGLRGEVTVEVRTDEPDARFADGAVLLTDAGPLAVESTRYMGPRLIVAFEGVPDRTAAELLRNTLLHVDAQTLPLPDDPDVFLDHHLVGLRAELEDGTPVGTVAEVLHLPHGDVLAVTRVDAAPGAAEVLVPFLTAMVPVVDVAGGRLVMTPPEGLLDLSEPAAGMNTEPDETGMNTEPDETEPR